MPSRSNNIPLGSPIQTDKTEAGLGADWPNRIKKEKFGFPMSFLYAISR